MTGADATSGQRVSRIQQTQALAEHALESLAEQLKQGNSERLTAFLSAAARFHRYSFSNLMLIVSQRPDATRVAGFHAWKQLGRSVRKGEKGIAIIAPMRIKAKDTQDASIRGKHERQKNDSAKSVMRFKVAYVFDISQTDGEPLPDLGRVGGDPGAMLERLEAGVMSAGIRLGESEVIDADGISKGGEIELRAGLEPAERFSVLVHEFAHELLHHQKLGQQADEPRPPKIVRETEAEAVAFAVCETVGLESNGAAADYIRLYQGDDETLAKSLARIRLAVSRVLQILDSSVAPEIDSKTSVVTTDEVLSRRSERMR